MLKPENGGKVLSWQLEVPVYLCMSCGSR